ncbi:O-antigen polymerase [Vibrio sp. Y184]|uniref:O-antigen polymerase n=1 Tax=Vibrio sp. Y184 TaxID=3074705 RepID=UPI0029667667|nr:O-antigen polymerase [Vibrio sp. Y184]MDW3167947.1 O-antigen polymerase [Vibrio sp. Y184]
MKVKSKYSISPSIFVATFFFIYSTLFLSGYIIFEWKRMSIVAIFSILLFMFGILFGTYIGERVSIVFKHKVIVIREKFLFFSWLGLTICVFISMYLMLKKYGSISYIISYAFVIREEVIGGDGFIPFYLSYINSLNQAFFAISVAVFNRYAKKRYCLLFFMNIVFCDLLSFGRVGTLFALFIIIGNIFFIKGFKIFNFKTFFYAIAAFFILNISRIIRGGEAGFSTSILGLQPYLKFDMPVWTYGLLSNYVYFFSSPIAFSEYIDNSERFDSEFGQRLFTPIYNIVLRIIGEQRINTIDPFVNIPYSTNIYTVLRDIYADIGVFGVLPLAMIFGFVFGYLYNAKTVFRESIFLMLMSCLMFFPLYNPLSFGMFLISILFLFFISFIFRLNLK